MAAIEDVREGPTVRRRKRSLDILFWVLAVGLMIAGLALAFTAADLYRQLAQARADLNQVRVELKADEGLRDKLGSAKKEIDQLCTAAKNEQAILALPKYARARAELGSDFFDRSHLIQSIACELP